MHFDPAKVLAFTRKVRRKEQLSMVLSPHFFFCTFSSSQLDRNETTASQKSGAEQLCVVAKSEKFWRAATKASKVWFSYSCNYTLANGAVFHSVCQV